MQSSMAVQALQAREALAAIEFLDASDDASKQDTLKGLVAQYCSQSSTILQYAGRPGLFLKIWLSPPGAWRFQLW